MSPRGFCSPGIQINLATSEDNCHWNHLNPIWPICVNNQKIRICFQYFVYIQHQGHEQHLLQHFRRRISAMNLGEVTSAFFGAGQTCGCPDPFSGRALKPMVLPEVSLKCQPAWGCAPKKVPWQPTVGFSASKSPMAWCVK